MIQCQETTKKAGSKSDWMVKGALPRTVIKVRCQLSDSKMPGGPERGPIIVAGI